MMYECMVYGITKILGICLVWLYLSHFGVEGHQDHFRVGRAVPISSWRRKVTKTGKFPRNFILG
jgi:hypothetical protein